MTPELAASIANGEVLASNATILKAEDVDMDDFHAALVEPGGFRRPKYDYNSCGSMRQYEKLVRNAHALIEASVAKNNAQMLKVQVRATEDLKPFWSCLKITLQDADWLRERSAYLPLVVAMCKNLLPSSQRSARIALTEALTHRKTTAEEIAKVGLALKVGRQLFGSWVPEDLAAAGLANVARNSADTAAMDAGVKELRRGAKRSAQVAEIDESCEECEELQKAREQGFVQQHGESGIGRNLDDRAIEREIWMASKRDTTYTCAEQQHNEVDYGDAQQAEDDD